MNFLSLQNTQNTFMKPHNNTFFLSETPSKTNFTTDNRQTQIIESSNQLSPNGHEKTLKELWSKHKMKMSQTKSEPIGNFDNIKMTWDVEKATEAAKEPETPAVENLPIAKKEEKVEEETSTKEESPSHHARRPPNAFLIFCKKHRPIVRERFPNLENRGVTKILGEWWALLNSVEKLPYSDLAKEYKDAFLSANPDFRWYKLPAPPLRTLSTRPLTAPKPHPSLSSPSNATTVTSTLSEFTPGKLADESQLGGLTSLMNNFVSMPKTEPESNNNIPKTQDKIDDAFVSPLHTIIRADMPPKPIKKRFMEYLETKAKGCARNILNDDESIEHFGNGINQDFINKSADDRFAKYDDSFDQNSSKETRKSERMCKGKRYERFMIEGKLLGNKRDTSKLAHQRQAHADPKTEADFNSLNNNKPETPKLDLGNTIKRLAERTNIKIDFDGDAVEREPRVEIKRERSISETSEGGGKNSPPNFNLNLRISNLPSLSYDEFMQRKRESKKRKARTKSESERRKKMQKLHKDTQLVGSKKRKNKHSITHLGNKSDSNISGDLLGLATLAEVAANTEKIDEKISE